MCSSTGCPALSPRGIEVETGLHGDLVVVRQSHEQRRRIRGNDRVLDDRRVDRSGKVGPAVAVVVERDARRDVAACREPHDADAIGAYTPLGSLCAHHPHCLQTIGHGHRRTSLVASSMRRSFSSKGSERTAAICCANSSAEGIVWTTRYFSTNAVTPRSCSQRATACPSW